MQLSNQKKFTIIKKISLNQRSYYVYRCSCGKEYTVRCDSKIATGHRSRICRCDELSIGKVFGSLIVQGDTRTSHRDKYKTDYKCLCVCGTIVWKEGSSLIRGIKSISCGCRRSSLDKSPWGYQRLGSDKKRKYTYSSWGHMMDRCYNKNHPHYARYGGRGITVCKKWEKFENFYLDMGERPLKFSLNRINNDLGYSRSNCNWVDAIVQNNNKSNNVHLNINGVTKPITEWALHYKINRNTVDSRMRRGVSAYDALTKPVKKKNL